MQKKAVPPFKEEEAVPSRTTMFYVSNINE